MSAVLLVRHAKAGSRHDWAGDDRLRPLTPRGKDQAEALVGVLLPYRPARVLSSPYVRCTETVAPLAAALGRPVEVLADLAEGEVGASRRLAASLAGQPVVVCSHGDIIPALLDELMALAGLTPPEDPPLAKGSVWIVGQDGSETPYARYLAPPGR